MNTEQAISIRPEAVAAAKLSHDQIGEILAAHLQGGRKLIIGSRLPRKLGEILPVAWIFGLDFISKMEHPFCVIRQVSAAEARENYPDALEAILPWGSGKDWPYYYEVTTD